MLEQKIKEQWLIISYLETKTNALRYDDKSKLKAGDKIGIKHILVKKKKYVSRNDKN